MTGSVSSRTTCSTSTTINAIPYRATKMVSVHSDEEKKIHHKVTKSQRKLKSSSFASLCLRGEYSEILGGGQDLPYGTTAQRAPAAISLHGVFAVLSAGFRLAEARSH
jgi:hypothetical protein